MREEAVAVYQHKRTKARMEEEGEHGFCLGPGHLAVSVSVSVLILSLSLSLSHTHTHIHTDGPFSHPPLLPLPLSHSQWT